MELFNNLQKKNNNDINIKLPWVEKYRPQNSEEILLEPFIKEKINKILENKSIPNMIITGEPGTGKTSTILFLAKQIYGNKYNDYVLELNASDDRGLSIINNSIIPFCKKNITINEKLSHKLIILDEADSITIKAQHLLANILGTYKKTVRIVFICNDCTQITETIQSRCMIIKYAKINTENLYNKIKSILLLENIKYDEDAIYNLLYISDNDIRQSINNLECIYYSFGYLSTENIYKLVDKPKPYYILEILNYCNNGNYTQVINYVKDLYNKGYTPNDILLTFMKSLMETSSLFLKKKDEITLDKINIIEESCQNNIEMLNLKSSISLLNEQKLKLYEIISLCYIRVNNGIDTLLQLCGCISKIYIYLQNENK
jgi:replication factor C subunit 2/4